MQGTCGLLTGVARPDGALLWWLWASQSTEKYLTMLSAPSDLETDEVCSASPDRRLLLLYRGPFAYVRAPC